MSVPSSPKCRASMGSASLSSLFPFLLFFFGHYFSLSFVILGDQMGRNGYHYYPADGGLFDIKWELRPGGMLVQKRDDGSGLGGEVIRVRISTGTSQWHDVSVEATSTFGELKVVLSLVTGLEARAQRLVYKGKEREDTDHLHMVGVRDMDKVLLLEDPAAKERKLHALMKKTHQVVMDTPPLPTIKV